MLDFNAQFIFDLLLCLLAFLILCVFIATPILVIIFWVKAIKNQNSHATLCQNEQNQQNKK